MEDIFTDERRVVHFDLYFTYLESVKELSPPHMFMRLLLTPNITVCMIVRAYTMPGSTTFILLSLPKGKEKSLGK